MIISKQIRIQTDGKLKNGCPKAKNRYVGL